MSPTVSPPLVFQRCRWCHTPSFRRVLCPACGSGELDEERSAGMGVVRSIRVVRQASAAPQAVAVVELEEGVRVRSVVLGGKCGPGGVFVGARVELTTAAGSSAHRPTFRLTASPLTR
ncbi:OB-fold domain-containing protein [Streptomyces sp. MK7]|uniref:Zn-ribbon domain-containing OB-fold protein n=1 Tax=Streptomyces sp. MK7 TaxID=3067635 RepID=UPI00292E850E|nr:OB-fold domain-containing protein [Streptomyces sp. MK7]